MNHDSYPDTYIRGILNTVKSIAMVGISPKDNRPSYFAFKYLLERGYRMIPVNPGPGRQGDPRPEGLRQARRHPRAGRHGRCLPRLAIRAGRGRRGAALKPTPARDLDAARRAQRRGRRQGRGRRPQGGDEPLPQDRIRPAVLGDRLDRRQFAHAQLETAPLLGKGVQRMSLNRTTMAGGAHATPPNGRRTMADPATKVVSFRVLCV